MTQERLQALTKYYIHRYAQLASTGPESCREEVSYCLGLWRSIALKSYDPARLDGWERQEVQEAIRMEPIDD